MHRTLLTSLAAAALAVACGGNTSPAGSQQVPAPPAGACSTGLEPLGTWFLAGSAPSQYTMTTAFLQGCTTAPALHLASSSATSSVFGTAMNEKPPGSFAGKRLRLSGWVTSDAVSGWAGLWMRVDTPQQRGAAFDNMMCRPITAITGWTKYDVVLDVAAGASDVAYGILLSGQGSVWLDGVVVEVVDPSVPVTGCSG